MFLYLYILLYDPYLEIQICTLKNEIWAKVAYIFPCSTYGPIYARIIWVGYLLRLFTPMCTGNGSRLSNQLSLATEVEPWKGIIRPSGAPCEREKMHTRREVMHANVKRCAEERGYMRIRAHVSQMHVDSTFLCAGSGTLSNARR
jgi:hypothetical protein